MASKKKSVKEFSVKLRAIVSRWLESTADADFIDMATDIEQYAEDTIVATVRRIPRSKVVDVIKACNDRLNYSKD